MRASPTLTKDDVWRLAAVEKLFGKDIERAVRRRRCRRRSRGDSTFGEPMPRQARGRLTDSFRCGAVTHVEREHRADEPSRHR